MSTVTELVLPTTASRWKSRVLQHGNYVTEADTLLYFPCSNALGRGMIKQENIYILKISTWYFKNYILTYSIQISGSLSVLLHGVNSGEGVITFVKDGKADYPRLEWKMDFHLDFRVQNKTSHRTATGTMLTHTYDMPPFCGTWHSSFPCRDVGARAARS